MIVRVGKILVAFLLRKGKTDPDSPKIIKRLPRGIYRNIENATVEEAADAFIEGRTPRFKTNNVQAFREGQEF